MPTIETSTSRSRVPGWLLLVVGLGVLLRIGFALLPLGQHLLLLEDDAWMVAAIARNWARGLGITADGMYPTNGFHPLYTLTLAVLPYVIDPNSLDTGFTASLLICALLASLVIWPLYRLTQRLGGPVAARIAVVLYALNPLMIRLTVNAMETAMALLLFVALLYAAYTTELRRPANVLLLALLTAITILTRLDASLLFAALVAARLIYAWYHRQLRATIPLLALYIAATFALLMPYFLRNWIVFGALSPSSGTALAYLHSYQGAYALSNGLGPFFLNSAAAADWIPSRLAMIALLLLAAFGLARTLGRELGRALPLLFYLPLPSLYYGYLMQQSNPRYFVGLSVILIILLSWALARWWERHHSPLNRNLVYATVALLALLNTASAVTFWREQRTSPQLTQPISYQAALWMRNNLPLGRLIGAKNSGIYQYYSGHTVINIDGKLNHEIVPVMRQRRLLDYIRGKGITYLVDREETLADHIQFYSAEFGPAPFHQLPGIRDRLRIYGGLVLSALRIAPPPEIDRRDQFEPARPFSDVGQVIKTFERPNEQKNPVVIVELLGLEHAGGAGQ